MKKLAIAVIALVTIGLASCAKEGIIPTPTDLIAQIKSAQKETVTVADLPSSARSILETNYTQSEVDQALLARGLGYEIDMRRMQGSQIGEAFQLYFDEIGTLLRSDDDCDEDDKDCDDDYEDYDECFEIIFPADLVMPDGTIITGTDEDALEDLVDAWYDANPDVEADPDWVYPISISLEDSIIVISDAAALDMAYDMYCDEDDDDYHEECFEIVFPVDVIMPDSTIITGADEDDLEMQIDAWYDANPDVDEEPEWVFPITIEFEDGTTMVINSEDELDDTYEEYCDCDEDDDDDDDDDDDGEDDED